MGRDISLCVSKIEASAEVPAFTSKFDARGQDAVHDAGAGGLRM
jgi:hypothetical protein